MPRAPYLGSPFHQRPLPLSLPLPLPVQTTVPSHQHLGPSSGHCLLIGFSGPPHQLELGWADWGRSPSPDSVIRVFLGPGLALLFLCCLWCSQAAAAELSITTETTWPAKPNIFTSRSFTGKVCQFLTRKMKSHRFLVWPVEAW